MIRLINTSGKHNKFWQADIDSNNTVTCKWGRVGTNGQSKTFDFHSKWAAEDFIDKKMREKRRKGYGEVDDEKFDLHVFRSQLVGAGAKINEICWLDRQPDVGDDTSYSMNPDVSTIANPSYEPAIYVDCQFTGRRGNYYLLITNDAVCYTGTKPKFLYSNPRLVVFKDMQPITAQSPKILRDLRDKADGMVHSLL